MWAQLVPASHGLSVAWPVRSYLNAYNCRAVFHSLLLLPTTEYDLTEVHLRLQSKGDKAGLASWYNRIRSYSPLAFDIKFFEPMFGCFGFFAVNWQVCYWVKKVQMMRSLKWDHSPCHLDQAALCSKSGLFTGCPCWGTAITGFQNINQSYSMLLAAFAFVSQDEGDAGVRGEP